MGILTFVMFAGAFLTFIASTVGILNPSGGFTGLLFGGFLGIGFFITGPMWLAFKFFRGTSESRSTIDMIIFEELNLIKLVDYIDKRANESVISNNNEWLKKNWHIMNDLEKQEWVKVRLIYLKVLLPPSDSAGSAIFITAIQNADKEYQRTQIKSA